LPTGVKGSLRRFAPLTPADNPNTKLPNAEPPITVHPEIEIERRLTPNTTLTAGGGTRRSRGHWGILDNVIGAPGARQRVSRDLRP
jgi:hypothetical protein